MTTAVKPSSSLILSASFLASPPISVLREESLSKTLTACDAWHLRSDKHQRSLFLTAGVSWQVQLLSAHGLSSAKRKKKKKKESLNFHPCQKQWRSHRADGNKRSKQKKDTEILEAQRSCETVSSLFLKSGSTKKGLWESMKLFHGFPVILAEKTCSD